MEALCKAVSAKKLPLVGHPEGDCVFVHQYVENKRPKLAHSMWRNGAEMRMIGDSWLSKFLHIRTESKHTWPSIPYTSLRQLGQMAFEHALSAFANKDANELSMALQTQYSMQLVNEASHLPIRTNVNSRIYTVKPFIIEIRA